MKERDFLKKKNVIDMDYQKVISLFNISAIVAATILVTLWFSGLDLGAKLSITVVTSISVGFATYALFSKIKLLRFKAENL